MRSHTMEQVLQPIDRFYDSVARNPDAAAIAGSGQGDITYAELGLAVAALGAALQDIDSTPGGRVGICAGNTIDHLLALLATYAAGKVWVPLNPRNARADLDAMIATTSPSIIVADAAYVERFTLGSARLIVAGSDAGTETVQALVSAWAGTTPSRSRVGSTRSPAESR